MLLPEELLAHGDGLLEQGLGLGILSLALEQGREVVQSVGHIRVLLAEEPSLHGQGLPEKRLGLGVSSLETSRPSRGEGGPPRRRRAPRRGASSAWRRLPEEPLRLGVVPLHLAERSEVVESRGHIRVLVPENASPRGQGRPQMRLGRVIQSQGRIGDADGVAHRGLDLRLVGQLRLDIRGGLVQDFAEPTHPALFARDSPNRASPGETR